MKVTKLWENKFNSSVGAEQLRVRAAELSPNNNHLFVGTDLALEVLDVSTGKVLQRLDGAHKGGVLSVHASRFGNWLVTEGKDSKAVVWDGSDLTPSKKFTVSSKKPSLLVEFNRNETHLYMIHEREIVKFFVKADKGSNKEVVRVAVKDRDILAACLVEKHGYILAYDSANFLSTYDLDGFSRSGVCQKPFPANVIRYFEPDKIWIAYSNNTLAVYDLPHDGEASFSALEKRTPFEVLDIRKVNEDTFAACGISADVLLLNPAGGVICKILSLNDTVLIKNLRCSLEKKLLFIWKNDLLQCLRLDHENSEQVIDGYRFSVSNLCTLSIQQFNDSQHSFKQTAFTIRLPGQVRGLHYCRESYLAVLLGEKGLSKLQLVPWREIAKELSQEILSTADDESDSALMDNNTAGVVKRGDRLMLNEEAQGLREDGQVVGIKNHEKALQRDMVHRKAGKRSKEASEQLAKKLLKDAMLDLCQAVYIGGSNLFLVQTQKITQTDFALRPLRSWAFEADITATEFLPNSKRKEGLLVGTSSGELYKIVADNSFMCQLVDYKVPIETLKASPNRQKLFLVDRNRNCALFDLRLGDCQAAQILTDAQIQQCGFSSSCSSLHYVLTQENSLALRYGEASVTVKDAIEKGEKIIAFLKNKLFVHSPQKEEQRIVDLNFSGLYSALIKSRKFTEAFDVMTSAGASSLDLKRLAITALGEGVCHEPILKGLRLAEDPELFLLASSLSNHTSSLQEGAQARLARKDSSEMAKHSKEKETQAKLQAELMAYDGRHSQAVEFLLKEKLPSLAVEMLVLLGKYDSAAKILKNPVFASQTASFDLKRLIKLQAEAALLRGDTSAAIELYNSIKDYEQIVRLLVSNDKTQELIATVRSLDPKVVPEALFHKACDYFKSKGQVPFAKECLLKLGNAIALIEFYMEFEQFEEALACTEKLQARLKDPLLVKRVYIAYSNYLLSESKFEEALAVFSKVGDKRACAELLRKLIFVNLKFGDFSRVAKLVYLISKMEPGDDSGPASVQPPSMALAFCRYVRSWQLLSASPIYDDYSRRMGAEPQFRVFAVKIFVILVNMISKESVLPVPFSLEKEIRLAASYAKELSCWQSLGFLSEAMVQFLPPSSETSKLSLLAQRGLAKAQTQGYLYECLACRHKGCRMNGFGCSECGLRLVFCDFSGVQLGVVRVTFSEEVRSQYLSQLDFYKHFESKPKRKDQSGRENEWGNESPNEEFLLFLQQRLARQRDRESLLIASVRDLSSMRYEQFWETRTGDYYYWTQRGCSEASNGIVACQECGSVYDSEVFEALVPERVCALCSSKLFSAFFAAE